jgi:hypothetical protein
LVAHIDDLQAARAACATDAELAAARDFQRKVQFFVEFIEVENSMGFQAPQEAARILAEAIDTSGAKEIRKYMARDESAVQRGRHRPCGDAHLGLSGTSTQRSWLLAVPGE